MNQSKLQDAFSRNVYELFFEFGDIYMPRPLFFFLIFIKDLWCHVFEEILKSPWTNQHTKSELYFDIVAEEKKNCSFIL